MYISISIYKYKIYTLFNHTRICKHIHDYLLIALPYIT